MLHAGVVQISLVSHNRPMLPEGLTAFRLVRDQTRESPMNCERSMARITSRRSTQLKQRSLEGAVRPRPAAALP